MMSGQKGRLWVFARHMRQHWRESLIIFFVLLSGFLFYTLYGSWAEAAASFEEVNVSPLRLPADVVLEIDHWAAQMRAPDLSPGQFVTEYYLQQQFVQHELWDRRIPRVYRPPSIPSVVQESVDGVSLRVMSAGGTVIMWGLPSVSDNLAESLPLLSGRWPEGTEEISIHREFADRSGLGVGEETSLAAMQAPGKITSGVQAEVVGVFGGNHDIYPEVLSSAGFAQQLAGGVSNLALLWAREVEPIEVESPMSPEVRTYRMPQLADLFEGFRWGTRAPAVEEFADTRDLHPSAARAGRTIPYGMLVQGRARIDGGEEPGLRGMYGGLGARLAQATLMIFFSQAVALTVILAIVVVDRQRTFGAYKVMGLASGGVWRLYFAQVLLTAAAAGLTGLLLFRLLAGVFGTMLGFTLHLPVLSVVLWGAAALALSVWSAHLASSLFDTTDIDSLLRETYDFDWWSLVRLTGLSVRR